MPEGRKTIKSLVFEYVHKREGAVDFEGLTRLVLDQFPGSAWKRSHWYWYRNQICSGKFWKQFSDKERRNLELNVPQARPDQIRNKTRGNPLAKRKNPKKLSQIFFVVKTDDVQEAIAKALAKTTYHVHPAIVQFVQQANQIYKQEFMTICPEGLDVRDYFYPGSACVFPGVRRSVGRLQSHQKRKYVSNEKGIIDDNIFPRQLFSFLSAGKSYSSGLWKEAGFDKFELAHVFSHKAETSPVEEDYFNHVDKIPKPYGLFTCASNVVLIPKGLAKPTDSLPAVMVVFFKRHIELYGEGILPRISSLKEACVPNWYENLKWNDPIRPGSWETRVQELLQYRRKRLRDLLCTKRDAS